MAHAERGEAAAAAAGRRAVISTGTEPTAAAVSAELQQYPLPDQTGSQRYTHPQGHSSLVKFHSHYFYTPTFPPGQQKDPPPNSSSSAGGQVTSSGSSSLLPGDLQIPTASADVAADIAKYTNKVSLKSRVHRENLETFGPRC